MPFTTETQLQIELHSNVDRRFHTLQTLIYKDSLEEGGNGIIYKVPAGTESDGASIPWGLRSVFNPYGVFLKSAILHDYLYQQGKTTRKLADQLFKRAMKSQRVKWRRPLMFAGVRAGGWTIWNRRHGRTK